VVGGGGCAAAAVVLALLLAASPIRSAGYSSTSRLLHIDSNEHGSARSARLSTSFSLLSFLLPPPPLSPLPESSPPALEYVRIASRQRSSRLSVSSPIGICSLQLHIPGTLVCASAHTAACLSTRLRPPRPSPIRCAVRSRFSRPKLTCVLDSRSTTSEIHTHGMASYRPARPAPIPEWRPRTHVSFRMSVALSLGRQ
jgi:hypothetical protein